VLDIVIRNGDVIDGSGGSRYRADVGLVEDRIVRVGKLDDMDAALAVDASGCVVTPGFVDMHSHTDFTIPILPTAESLAHQGITTAVMGQCGSSPAPLLPDTRQQVVAMMQSEDVPLPWEAWGSFGSYLDYVRDTGTSINLVPLVGQGVVRAGVMGYTAEAANPAQRSRMVAEIEKALDEGAVGLSTGLIYPPGSYCSTEELVDVTRPVGKRGGFYFSHIRGEGETLLQAIAEAIQIGREAGAAVQISHFKAVGEPNWHKSALALRLIDDARDEGLDVTADLYPYLASSTDLTATLPDWAKEGGKEAILSRLRRSESRDKMAADMRSGGYASQVRWDQVLISNAPKNRSYEGRRIADLAKEAGKAPHTWIFDALLETDLDIGMISFGMSLENRKQELRHPAMMVGTDGTSLATEGPLSSGRPHPRSYGTFPRVLGFFVREQGVLSLEEAVWKMTGFPAQKLRWSDRGLIREGYKADLVVFDPETVTDRATFEAPHRYPAGIRYVLVNGQLVIQQETHTGARPGEILS
jgi:N-acyl-D-amino-acid deacylase